MGATKKKEPFSGNVMHSFALPENPTEVVGY